MARKKEITVHLSEEEQKQVERLLEQYHQVAQELHQSTDQAQAEAALAAFNALPESVQLALLKALSKEQATDAADIIAAVNAFSPQKEVRKEARRALIRLEATRTYPAWTPPIAHTPVIQVNVANPPRFWKGYVTQAREQGEIQLWLAFEQGYDYTEVRFFSFLLDFWQDGVKDAFIDIMGKRRFNERIAETRARLEDVPLVECTLAEGRRLLEEALSVNNWRGTTPHRDYRNQESQVSTYILQVTEPGEDRGLTFINPELEDEEVVVNFLGGWSMGDFGLAYDLLTHNSSLREGLSRDEWIERRRAWADEAHPARLELGFVRQGEQSQSALWVPSSSFGGPSASRKEIEVGWSLELDETPLSGTLREMPMGTAVNKETRRHWFWTGYTAVREKDGWRIQRFTDDGASIQGLPIQDLQQRIKEYEDTIQELLKLRYENLQEFMEEIPWRYTQLMHYYDALIARLPLDRKVVDDAYNRSIALGNPERTMVYLERLVQRFPQQRAEMLRNLGATQIAYAYGDRTQVIPNRREHFLALAEKSLREAIALEEHAVRGHLLLAELFLSSQRNDEAESELRAARALHPGREDEAIIEAGSGNIAMRREQFDEALLHFKRVAEIDPQYPSIWFNLGFAHRLLGHIDEAEESYKRAVEANPEDIRIYSELIAIYMNRSDTRQARRIAEQGVEANPDSAHLHALFASVLFERGERREAQRQLEEAESIDPELDIVQNVRQLYMKAAKKH